MERELFATDVEGIEGVGAVGAVFEQVFFRFGKFLAAFVFAKSICKDNIRCEQKSSTSILFNLK